MIRGESRYSPERLLPVLWRVWLTPRSFFKRLDPRGGKVRPAASAALVLYLNLILGTALQALRTTEPTIALLYVPLLGIVVAAVLGPLLLAGFTALVLVVLRGTLPRGEFGPLFRSLGYVSAVGVVLWVPYGPLIALPYGACVATIAVTETLRTSWYRAAASVLIPLGALLAILLILVGPAKFYELLL